MSVWACLQDQSIFLPLDRPSQVVRQRFGFQRRADQQELGVLRIRVLQHLDVLDRDVFSQSHF